MNLDEIITKICNLENISIDYFKDYIKTFEKFIKSEIKKYDDKSGLEDYKMHKADYYILLQLHMKTKKTAYKTHILLLYMYSYYKLDGIDFNCDNFPMDLFFKFINNNKNIHSLILKLLSLKKFKDIN
jgi:hypothetical protein